jgi:hypothetical protein
MKLSSHKLMDVIWQTQIKQIVRNVLFKHSNGEMSVGRCSTDCIINAASLDEEQREAIIDQLVDDGISVSKATLHAGIKRLVGLNKVMWTSKKVRNQPFSISDFTLMRKVYLEARSEWLSRDVPLGYQAGVIRSADVPNFEQQCAVIEKSLLEKYGEAVSESVLG